jgi:hypothetical protein
MFEYALKKKAKRRKLKEIEVEEISLVDKAANQKTFAIVKRDGAADPEGILELLKDFAGQEVTDEDLELAETPEKALAIIKDALKKLTPYLTGDLFPDDVEAAIKTLGKFAGIGYGYSPAPGDGDGQDGGDDQAKDEGADENFEDRKKRVRKNAECFISLDPLLLSLPAFARRIQKARAAAADQVDDDDGQDQDQETVETLKLKLEKKNKEIKDLRRRSAQVKDDGGDDADDIEKGKDGKPVPEWPSVIIPGFF